MSDKIHAGLWTDCKNCNPDWKPKKRDRKDRGVKYMGGEVSVELSVRRQVSAELGDEEPNKDAKFALLQKYGAAAARIDRNVTKPTWQEESVWRAQKGQYDKAVKGLVPREQVKMNRPFPSREPNPQYRRNSQNRWGNRSSQPTRPNSNPTRTGTRQP